MSIFGFDSFADMFDGGGKGGSGDQFYGGTNEEYVAEGGTNTGGDDNTFIGRVVNTAQNENNLTYDPPDPPIFQDDDNNGGGGGGTQITTSLPSDSGEEEQGGNTAEDILAMAQEAGIIQNNEDLEAMIADPQGFLESRGMTLSDLITLINPDAPGTTLDPNNPNYALDGDLSYDPETVGETATINNPGTGTPTFYNASTVTNLMGGDSTTVNAATTTVTDNMLVDPDDVQIDVEGIAAGGGVLGNALNDFASQDISQVIDTSTVAGKLLADKLGEGNYTDAKATVLGQMKIISAEFKDANGNPKIPPWAQGLSREVSRMMAFKGVSGTAAVATMSNALMEATLGVAEKDAAFFQTLTIKNLDNRQQQIINKANVLAQFEVANLDARQTALVNNAKAFLQVDLANLANKQQAEVINTQAMVQALFTDQAAINAERLFTAETMNEFEKFYDQLSVQVQQFNAGQINAMNQFNAGEVNAAAQFNANMENNRQQFYANMQFNIDTANAKWRQTVETENTRLQYEALAFDVKNMLNITQEAQNQLWDRVDSMFDYIWKSSESELQREAQILMAEMQAAAARGGGGSGLMGALGNVVGAFAGSKAGSSLIAKGISAVAGLFSDERLKENIEHFETLPNGLDMYTWTWTDEAIELGAGEQPTIGVIAQRVQETHPDAVFRGEDGYLRVDYGVIDEIR